MTKNIHTFSVIVLSVQTGTQIGDVWQYLYIQRGSYLSRLLLNLHQIFTIIHIFSSNFWQC